MHPIGTQIALEKQPLTGWPDQATGLQRCVEEIRRRVQSLRG